MGETNLLSEPLAGKEAGVARFVTDHGLTSSPRRTGRRRNTDVEPREFNSKGRSASKTKIAAARYAHRSASAPPPTLGAAQTQTKGSRLLRAALVFGFGVLRATGQKNRILRKLAFFPPSPARYTVTPLASPPSRTTSAPSWLQPCMSRRSLSVTPCLMTLMSPDSPHGLSASDVVAQMADEKLRLYAGKVSLTGAPSVAFCLIWHHDQPPPSDGEEEDPSINVTSQGCPDPTELNKRPFIIYSHGNSTDIGQSFTGFISLAARVNANVLAYDYTGYGCSDGKVTDKGAIASLALMHELAVSHLSIGHRRIVLYGQSIGSMVTCAIAARPIEFPVAAVILHSAFASGLRLLLGDPSHIPLLDVFINAEKVANCPWPIQFIHGAQDTIVPLWHCTLLYELASDPVRPNKQSRQVFEESVIPLLEDQWWNFGSRRAARLTSEGRKEGQLPRWWGRRLSCWIAEHAGHNDIELRHKKDYFNVVGTFLSLFA